MRHLSPSRSNGTKVRVQAGQEFAEQSLQRQFLFLRQETSLVCASQEVAHFIERSAGGANETLVVCRRCPAIAFGNVGPYTVSRANELVANGGLGERVPGSSYIP